MYILQYFHFPELPTCYGETDVRSGEEASLSCEMAYSGHNPNLEWLEAGEPINSMDEYEIRIAKKVIHLNATSKHDGLRFQCGMAIGSTVHECFLTLNVTCKYNNITMIQSSVLLARFGVRPLWSGSTKDHPHTLPFRWLTF